MHQTKTNSQKSLRARDDGSKISISAIYIIARDYIEDDVSLPPKLNAVVLETTCGDRKLPEALRKIIYSFYYVEVMIFVKWRRKRRMYYLVFRDGLLISRSEHSLRRLSLFTREGCC